MSHQKASALASTTLFVLLWSSGAIISEIGIRHGSPFALLLVRYALALAVVTAVALANRQLLPETGTRRRVAITGFSIAGVYSIFYLLALDHGVTPGALATLLGIQPILTAWITERRVSVMRMLGLLCAMAGLALIVLDGLAALRFDAVGIGFALLSLLGITFGSLLQKRETQAPWVVLPLQYAVGFVLLCVMAPFVPLHASWDAEFVLSAVSLALVTSVGAVFLLYRLIARGNLVNVTSLFYLVPGVTAAMDWLFLGNPMSVAALFGLGMVMASLILVFRERPA